MAFLSKIGNILRQTTSTQINAQLSASRPGLLQAFRCMSTSPSSKLFVGGVSYQTDDQSLREAFSKYGEVIEARIIMDRETGRSRGFGFVTFASTEDASSAIQAMDGQTLHGRQVRVNYAAERPPRSGGYGGGGYGGGGGGYGGGGYGGGGGGYGGGGYGGAGYGAGGYGSGGYSGGGGGYSGGGGGYGGNNNSSPGNYGGNMNSGSSGTYGGQGNYGGGFANQPGANTFDGGNLNVAGGGGGSDSFGAGGSGGFGGDNLGFGGDDQLDIPGGSQEDMSRGFDQNDPLNENLRDEDDDTGDFAKRA